jgi:hypothetical protein
MNNGILYKGFDNPQFSAWYSTFVAYPNGELHWARVEFTDEAFVTGIQLANAPSQTWYNNWQPITPGYVNAAVIVGNNANVLSTENSICKIFTGGEVDENLRTFNCDTAVKGKYIFISNRFGQGGNGKMIGIYELTVQGYRVNGASCTACTAGTYKDTLGSAACTNCPANTYSGMSAARNVSVCTQCYTNSIAPAGSDDIYDCGCSSGYEFL